MAQVFNGASILVDLSSIYGLYPHFLNPIFNLVGLSVLSYSIIMSGFICLSYLCIFLLIRKAVANSLLVCLGFFSLIFYHKFFVGVYIGGGGGFDPYFQYDPIRIIFPSVFLLLASFYLLKPNKFNYFTTSLVASTGVLWNLDSGVVTFASWLLLLTYDELFKNDKKVFFKKIARHLSLNIVLLIISLTLFSIYIHSRSGFYPDWDLAFKFQNIFYMAGFMMMPMPVFHVWNLIILTYILGLVYSFSHLYERKNTFLPKIIFVISILGLGLFSYYQGRSHDYNLTLVSYPSFILLTIFADRILQNFKSSAIELKLIYFVCIFLFVIPIQVIFFQGKALVVYEQILRGINSLNKDSTSPLQRENFQFIKNNTSPNDKILILCAPHEQGIYYLSTNTQSAIRTPGSTGVPLVEDEHKLRLLLASANNIKIFADFSVVDPKVKLILESDYIFKGQVSASGMKFYEGKNCPPSRLLPDKNLQMKQLPGHNRECWVYLAGQVP